MRSYSTSLLRLQEREVSSRKMALKPYIPKMEEQLPDGEQTVVVMDIKEMSNRFYKPGEPENRQKQYQIKVEGLSNNGIATAWFGNSLGDKANLTSFAAVVLDKKGLTQEEKENLDLEELVGKELIAQIEHKKDSNGNVWARVTGWRPLKSS